MTCNFPALYLRSSDYDSSPKLEGFVWEERLLPPSHASAVSIQLLVNSTIFKTVVKSSLYTLKAQSPCYKLKGDLSPVMFKKIFHNSFSKFFLFKFRSLQGFVWKTNQALLSKSCFSHINPSNFWQLLQSLLLSYRAENLQVTKF